MAYDPSRLPCSLFPPSGKLCVPPGQKWGSLGLRCHPLWWSRPTPTWEHHVAHS